MTVMIWLAAALGMLSLLLVAVAARGRWASRAAPRRCGVSAPGGARCSRKLGHNGSHRNDDMEWFGDAWWLPPETLGAVRALIEDPASKLPKRKPLKPAALWIGSAVLVFIAVGALLVVERVANAPKPGSHAHCAAQHEAAGPPRLLCRIRPQQRTTP